MAVDERLLAQAQQNPAGLAFEDAVTLAEQFGWQLVRIRGSHHIFHHPQAALMHERYPKPLNLQRGKNGKAKAYQVRDMVSRANAMGLLP